MRFGAGREPRPLDPRAEAVLMRAWELPADDVDAFLRDACGDDEVLRGEVESMLRAAGDADRYFEGLAGRLGVAAALADEDPAIIGRRLGAYRLLELIGRGGMGAVYLAERADRQYEKQVAVKVLPVGYSAPGAVSRFLAERQLLARLVHPNIARLLDGGVTDDGTPFFVMDYVDGAPIDDYCQAHGLGVAERLRLFLQVCEAVAYAHRHLIVHRDLKPGNVLVEATGQVVLLDFGVARLLEQGRAEETRLTEIAGRALTPEYAAPERIRGEPLTVTADVYSLGVLLYELLADRRPYSLGRLSPSALEQAILRAEPSRLSDAAPGDRRRLLRGDLDNIVAKALNRQREERYATVDALAGDITRHLDGRPVHAQPASRWYVLSKFVTRNRWAVGAGSALLLAVLAGSGLVIWQAQRVRAEAAITEEVAEFLVSIFTVSDPGEARGNSVTAREILDRGASDITEGLQRDPVVRARLMGVIGRVYRALGLYEPARELLSDALDIERRNLGEEKPQTLRTLNELADVHTMLGEYVTAEAMLSEALEVQLRSLGPEHADTLNSMNDLAISHARQGRFAEGVSLLEGVVGARRPALGLEHRDTLFALHNLAVMYKM